MADISNYTYFRYSKYVVTSQYVWVGIAVGVFLAGIAIGYGISFNPAAYAMPNQQMMLSQMMNDQAGRQQMMTSMMQNQQFMQQIMDDQQFRAQMIEHMKTNQQFSQNMTSAMMADPEVSNQILCKG